MSEKLIKCVVLRDVWTEDGRQRAGKEVEIPAEAAMDGIENGTLKRVKAEKAKKADK